MVVPCDFQVIRMRTFPIFFATAVALTMAFSASGAVQHSSASIPTSHTVTQGGVTRVVSSNHISATPPGVLKFGEREANRRLWVAQGTIAALYSVTLPKGKNGRLVIVKFPKSDPEAIVQPVTKTFSLHKGDQIIVVTSPVNSWRRVLPYKGPQLQPSSDD